MLDVCLPRTARAAAGCIAAIAAVLLVGCGSGNQNPRACLENCESASDCDSQQTAPDDWACREGACTPDQCEQDGDCPPSGWRQKGCSADACSRGFVCVDHAGEARCAPQPADGNCSNGSKTQKPRVGGDESVAVCLRKSVCDRNRCRPRNAMNCSNERVKCANGGTCQEGRCVCDEGACNADYQCASIR